MQTLSKIFPQIKNYIEKEKTSILLVGDFPLEEIQSFFKPSFEDILILRSQIIKIGEIRALIRWINFKPQKSQYKFVFIVDAEKMTVEASNALLKTLEEPPVHSIIMLSTKDEEKILPTIRSRLLRLQFRDPHKKLEPPQDYKSPKEISQMNFRERFSWAEEIAESPDLKTILTLWQIYFREKLLEGKDVLGILGKIARAKGLLGTNISVKLLLENLLLNF